MSTRLAERDARAKATGYSFNAHVTEISEGLLSQDEEDGLRAALPRLADLADKMGCLERPVTDWAPEEMMRFLALAVRAAVPLRRICHLDPNLNDKLPW